MSDSSQIPLNPPARNRADSRVKTNLRGAYIALAFAVLAQVALIGGLVEFNSSLRHHLPGHTTCPPASMVVTITTVASVATTPSTVNLNPGIPGLGIDTGQAPTTRTLKVDCGVAGAGLTFAHVVEILIGLAGFLAPFYALLAVLRAAKSRRLVTLGNSNDARIAAEDSRDAVWYVIGFGLTVAVLAFLGFFLAGSGGAVRTSLFNWKYPLRSGSALPRAFLWNIALFAVTEVFVLAWALVIAVVRQLPGKPTRPIRWLAIAYTDVFRGVPAIIVIYLVGFGLPLGKVWPFTALHHDAQTFWLGVLALTLVYSAYVAEVYRAGIESIHWSQTAAARSLGLSQWQTYRHVIVPQAIRRIIPPLLNDFVALQKDTALVGFVGLIEVLNQSNLLNSHFFNLTPITAAAVIFLIPTIPLTRFVDYLIRRDQSRTLAG